MKITTETVYVCTFIACHSLKLSIELYCYKCVILFAILMNIRYDYNFMLCSMLFLTFLLLLYFVEMIRLCLFYFSFIYSIDRMKLLALAKLQCMLRSVDASFRNSIVIFSLCAFHFYARQIANYRFLVFSTSGHGSCGNLHQHKEIPVSAYIMACDHSLFSFSF